MKLFKKSVFVLLIICGLFGVAAPAITKADTAITTSVDAKTLIKLTNEERVRNNLSRVKESALLNEVAKLKAEDMVKNGYFAHISPTGNDAWHWFQLAGYKFRNAGENLAVLFNDSESVVKAWINSPSHRANVLGAKYTEIGMAVVSGTYNGKETNYVVEVFGKPQTAPKVAATTKTVKKLAVVIPKQYTNLVTQK